MVDVAAIFDEVFGADDQDKGLPENGCVRCVGVSGRHKPLECLDNQNTPAGDKRHTLKQGVSETDERCARFIVKNKKLRAMTHLHTEHTERRVPLHYRLTPTHSKNARGSWSLTAG